MLGERNRIIMASISSFGIDWRVHQGMYHQLLSPRKLGQSRLGKKSMRTRHYEELTTAVKQNVELRWIRTCAVRQVYLWQTVRRNTLEITTLNGAKHAMIDVKILSNHYDCEICHLKVRCELQNSPCTKVNTEALHLTQIPVLSSVFSVLASRSRIIVWLGVHFPKPEGFRKHQQRV